MIPVVRVGMSLVDPVDMIPGDPEGRLRAPNPVVRVDPQRWYRARWPGWSRGTGRPRI